jgi:hypothetical protein
LIETVLRFVNFAKGSKLAVNSTAKTLISFRIRGKRNTKSMKRRHLKMRPKRSDAANVRRQKVREFGEYSCVLYGEGQPLLRDEGKEQQRALARAQKAEDFEIQVECRPDISEKD